jgi:hypothetical protein
MYNLSTLAALELSAILEEKASANGGMTHLSDKLMTESIFEGAFCVRTPLTENQVPVVKDWPLNHWPFLHHNSALSVQCKGDEQKKRKRIFHKEAVESAG